MGAKILNKSAFLREQRTFPQEAQPLSVEMDRSYVEIANKINDRTIGFFATTYPSVTGEKWLINGVTYQGFRQLYTFTSSGNINHNLDIANMYTFTRSYGMFSDGTNWYPLPYVNATAVANQVQVIVTPTQIQITTGGGAPAISSGFVVLEWIV